MKYSVKVIRTVQHRFIVEIDDNKDWANGNNPKNEALGKALDMASNFDWSCEEPSYIADAHRKK